MQHVHHYRNTTSKEKTEQKRQKPRRRWTLTLIMNDSKLFHHKVFYVTIISDALKSRTFWRRENSSCSDWVDIKILEAMLSLDHHRSLTIVIKKLNCSIGTRNFNIFL